MIVDTFCEPTFSDKFRALMSIEEVKGEDKFNPTMFALFHVSDSLEMSLPELFLLIYLSSYSSNCQKKKLFNAYHVRITRKQTMCFRESSATSTICACLHSWNTSRYWLQAKRLTSFFLSNDAHNWCFLRTGWRFFSFGVLYPHSHQRVGDFCRASRTRRKHSVRELRQRKKQQKRWKASGTDSALGFFFKGAHIGFTRRAGKRSIMARKFIIEAVFFFISVLAFLQKYSRRGGYIVNRTATRSWLPKWWLASSTVARCGLFKRLIWKKSRKQSIFFKRSWRLEWSESCVGVICSFYR